QEARRGPEDRPGLDRDAALPDQIADPQLAAIGIDRIDQVIAAQPLAEPDPLAQRREQLAVASGPGQDLAVVAVLEPARQKVMKPGERRGLLDRAAVVVAARVVDVPAQPPAAEPLLIEPGRHRHPIELAQASAAAPDPQPKQPPAVLVADSIELAQPIPEALSLVGLGRALLMLGVQPGVPGAAEEVALDRGRADRGGPVLGRAI